MARLSNLAPFALIGLVSGLAWLVPGLAGLALLSPVIAWRMPSWPRVWLAMGIYYAIPTASLPWSAQVFFLREDAWLLGAGLWLAMAALLGGLWAVIWISDRRWWRVAIFLVFAYVAISIPPFGLVSWLNPLLGAGDLWPGFGLLAWLLALVVQVVWIANTSHRVRYIVSAGAAVSALCATWWFVPLPVPPHWIPVHTAQGGLHQDAMALMTRNSVPASRVLRQITPSTEVAVLPETVAGQWDEVSAIYWSRLQIDRVKRPVVMVIGASVPVSVANPAGAQRNAAIVMMQGEIIATIYARHPIPFGMWHPWHQSPATPHYPLTIRSPAATPIPSAHRVHKVNFLFCYEELLLLPYLQDVLYDRPEVTISLVNHWWDRDGLAGRIQANHARLLSRTFNIPMLRAVNGPKTTPRGEAPN